MAEKVGGYKGDPPVGVIGDPPIGSFEGIKPGGAKLEANKVGG